MTIDLAKNLKLDSGTIARFDVQPRPPIGRRSTYLRRCQSCAAPGEAVVVTLPTGQLVNAVLCGPCYGFFPTK